MNIHDKLRQLAESERRNQEHERQYKEEKRMPKYTLSRAEQETTIRWDAEERIAHIFTASEPVRRKLDRLSEEFPDVYRCVWSNPEGYGWKYEAPADYIRFRKPPTEAQREAGKRVAALLHGNA